MSRNTSFSTTMSTKETEGFTKSAPRLHYLQWGAPSAPPLLLLHASGCHAHWWENVAPIFAARYRVIAVDLRGHGASERPADGDYRFTAHVSDVERLIGELDLGPHRIVGHSMGGYVALQYASRQPESLVALVVADMICELSGEALDRLHEASRRPQPTFDTADEAIKRFKLLPAETNAPREVLDKLARHAVVPLPDGRFGFAFDRRAMGHPMVNAWPYAQTVHCPTMVIRGEMSTIMSAEDVERLSAMLARGTAACVENAYHHLMLDNPAKFTTLVREFLEVSRS